MQDIAGGLDVLIESADPVASPHQHKRPSVGWMLKATFGMAYYDNDNELSLAWINEVAEQEKCA